MQAEARIEAFMISRNRPSNAQIVADFLAVEGFKKPQVQKALDSLAESNRITCKVSGLWAAALLAVSLTASQVLRNRVDQRGKANHWR